VVVEGDSASSEFLSVSLPDTEFEVVHVTSIEGALREVRATARAVVVVDDDLPLVRGLDLVGRLRSERSDLESILMTRDDTIASFAARLHVERFRCLRRPFALEDLASSVIESLERLTRRERTIELVANAGKEGEHEALRRRIEALERASRSMSQVPPAPPPSTTRNSPPFPPPPALPTPVDGLEPEEVVGELVEPKTLRVLVVDDDPLVRNAMARTFKRHQVTTASNGRAATEEIERSKPDIIISDLKMPEMDGIEMAEEIKVRWPELSSRIVFVSGTASQIERARKIAPQQPLLTKPVSHKLLEQRIAEVLEAAIRRR
jgi:DNA-binding NtrC family response regulator